LSAIHFNDELLVSAYEVGDIRTDCFLPYEFETSETAITQ